MKLLYEDERTRESILDSGAPKPKPEPILLFHFFWLAGNPFPRAAKGFWASILHQLLQQRLALLSKLCNRHEHNDKSSLEDWSAKELSATLALVVETVEHPLYIFLGGLDELDPTEGVSGSRQLLAALCNFNRSADPHRESNHYSQPRVKLSVSSRPELAFIQQLGGAPQLHLHKLTERDIEEVAEARLQNAASEVRFGFNTGESAPTVSLLR